MTDGPRPLDSPTMVHAAWMYTEAEVAAYVRMARRRLAAAFRSDADSRYFQFAILGTLCIAAGLVAIATGAVKDVRNPTVPLACAAVYYLGHWIDQAMQWRHWKREREDNSSRAFAITIDAAGIAWKGPDERYACDWSKLRSIRIVDGFLVFWLGRQGGIYVPTRALAEGDLQRIRAFAPEALTRRR